jgi:hypothetical protein
LEHTINVVIDSVSDDVVVVVAAAVLLPSSFITLNTFCVGVITGCFSVDTDDGFEAMEEEDTIDASRAVAEIFCLR